MPAPALSPQAGFAQCPQGMGRAVRRVQTARLHRCQEARVSLMHPYVITDRQGRRHATVLADCLNVQRTPRARTLILERSFHRLEVDGAGMQVEKAFFYLDLARSQAFLVQPPRERYRHGEASAALARMLLVLPPQMRERAGQLRVVYGVEELREKLVAADAALDDRAVELMKAALVHDHPVLLTRARLRLVLDRVDAQGARFLASYDHASKAFELTYAMPELLGNEAKALRKWSGVLQRHDLYALEARGDHWVNYRRWLPSQDAVAELHACVQALATGKPPAPGAAAFKAMLQRLPRGAALSSQGKQDLRKLFLWAKKKGLQALQDQLFELRFGVALEDSWYRNDDKNDIDTLWRLLKNLPDAHVEGNSKLAEIQLGTGGGGTYSPATHEIEIGSSELAFKERFEDTLRHEVGHAVHEARPDLVNGWLWERFGWAEFQTTSQGIDDWAAQMGPASGWAELSAAHKGQVRSLLRQACGPGSQWGPTVTPSAPAGSAWLQPKFGPRLAFEMSGSTWYAHNASWYRAAGKAFAVNFWYGSLMCVSEATLDFVNRKMPDNYAAMSPAEFFAELYALYYDVGDPQRKHIPADVSKWMASQLGTATATQPAKPAAAGAKGRKNVLRPQRGKPGAST